MNILIVDDSREDRELVITYLKQSNKSYTVHADESSCLKEALKKIEIHNYDVILLDLALPETDGLQTIQAIMEKMEEEQKQIPVVILTGFEDYTIGRKAFSLGIKNFLIKDEISSKEIERALRMATYNKETDSIIKKTKKTISA